MVAAMTEDGTTADHVLANRASWDAYADSWVDRGRILWAADEITWGIWGVPESELRLLPEIRGIDAVELGCGTGYVSSWLARRGARPNGLDNSARQLATAKRFQEECGTRLPLIHGDAERVPLRDATFDLAISEYGAAIWCDPYRDPRGGAAPPPRRAAGVPRALLPRDADVPRRGAAGDRAAAA
jgi:SAM-dependent methyltransferase